MFRHRSLTRRVLRTLYRTSASEAAPPSEATVADIFGAKLEYNWIPVADDITLDGSSRVEQWDEHEGGAASDALAQSTAGNRLYYTASDSDGNNQPSVNTGAAALSHSLNLNNPGTGGISLAVGTTGCEVWIVLKMRTGYDGGLSYVLTDADGSPYMMRSLGPDNDIRADIGSGNIMTVDGGSTQLCAYRLTCSAPTGGQSTCRLHRRAADGTTAQSSEEAIAVTTMAGMQLITGCPVSIFQIVYLNAPASAQELSDMDDYLVSHFGMT